MDNNHEATVISGSDYRRLMVLLVVLSVFIPLIAGLGVSWGDWPLLGAVLAVGAALAVMTTLAYLLTKNRAQHVREDETRSWWWAVGTLVRDGLAVSAAIRLLSLL